MFNIPGYTAHKQSIRPVIILYNLVMDTGNMSTYSDGNVTNKYNITAVYKSTVILPCHLKHNTTKPVWLQNHLILNSKVNV